MQLVNDLKNRRKTLETYLTKNHWPELAACTLADQQSPVRQRPGRRRLFTEAAETARGLRDGRGLLPLHHRNVVVPPDRPIPVPPAEFRGVVDFFLNAYDHFLDCIGKNSDFFPQLHLPVRSSR
jgi:hypothetical protein